MQQSWTLHVRNFGPIQSADIDIHPFMMFVGPNNSGKSYLTTLIWGLLTHGKILFDSASDGPAYQACCAWVMQEENNAREQAKKGDDPYVSIIGTDETKLFIDWLNESLHNRKKEFLKTLFNSDVIDIGELSVRDYSRRRLVNINWVLSDSSNQISRTGDKFEFYFTHQQTKLNSFRVNIILAHLVVGGISDSIGSIIGLGGRYDFRVIDGVSLYLPSARTGFMLNFRALASSTIEQGFSLQNRPKGLHTTPTINFLQSLIELPKEEQNNSYCEVVEWLEHEVIKGNFVRQDDVLPDYYYRSQEISQPFSLHVCSSLVTELAPLVLFLKGCSGYYGSLIIEEPEAHLHPAAQRKVAQALVRLVNKGLPVWITTHSDIMFQQFNNFITLSHLPNRVEVCQSMGYEASDVLDPKDVMAYQFVMEEGGTVVKPLRLIETGFEAPSFNQTLSDLTAETIRLHDLIDESENSGS